LSRVLVWILLTADLWFAMVPLFFYSL